MGICRILIIDTLCFISRFYKNIGLLCFASSQDTNSMERISHVLKKSSAALRIRGFVITYKFPS
jgi:hypothetical protein